MEGVLPDKKGEREKRLVAFSSVIAAIFLTVIKLIVGLLTRSLGLLSEAAHSGLDIVAAAVTFFAVRASDRPADATHTYGHGKVENFSALIETLLLFITCAWIVYEAVKRLFFQEVVVEANYWSFIVMGLSIVIDVSRSRALMRVAKKHGSQALEADALHFSTDIWSSAVVIGGLIAVIIGQAVEPSNPELASWLFRADAIAALGVSGIILFVSYKMGRRSIKSLMDSAPQGVNLEIEKAVANLQGVVAVERVRSRQSGPSTFVDMTLAVESTASLEEAHAIAENAESAVRDLLPRCDVMVHVDPIVMSDSSLLECVRGVAARQGIDVHGLHVYDVRGYMQLELHAEVPENLSVRQAHKLITLLEQAIKQDIPQLTEVTVHIEPKGDSEVNTAILASSSSDIESEVKNLNSEIPEFLDFHRICVLRRDKWVLLSFHCTVSSDMLISKAHELTSRAEDRLRRRIPSLRRVIIHVEPEEDFR